MDRGLGGLGEGTSTSRHGGAEAARLRRQATRLRALARVLRPLNRGWIRTQRLRHPVPHVRLDAMRLREEPSAGVPHVRSWAGVPSDRHPYRDG
jgi:hypothetical protein